MKDFRNILWGIILIGLGIVLGINTLGIADIDIFFNGWWTLFIIVPCFINLFSDEDKTGNIIGLLIGIVLLLSCQKVLDFSVIWKLLFPTILVIIGLSCIFKNTLFISKTRKIKKASDKDNNLIATFSSQKIKYEGDSFKGCNIDAIFGGVDLDLRKAEIKEDVVINATSVFGGIDIHVPNNVKVKVTSTAIFGGVDNKCKNSGSECVIYINATCLFGGVNIK